MSDFIHGREYLQEGDVVVVDCSHRCNVRLTDDYNFGLFRSGRSHRYFGGAFEYFPCEIVVPHTGSWNVTIDLGGGKANIQYSINYLKRAA